MIATDPPALPVDQSNAKHVHRVWSPVDAPAPHMFSTGRMAMK